MKNAEQLSSIVENTFLTLEFAIGEASEAEALLVCAQAELYDARCRVLLTHDAADLGKNEAQREARLAELTAEERKTVRLAEAQRHEARTRLEVCRLRKEQAMADLRLLELGARSELTPLRVA